MTRRTSPAWAQLSEQCDTAGILYRSQLSPALLPEDFPQEIVWTRAMWAKLRRALRERAPIGPEDYPECQDDMTLAVERWASQTARALVVGSVSPWIEAILFERGCRDITTIDVRRTHSTVEELKTVTYDDVEVGSLEVDLLVSFSTVEHIGLGRYGDRVAADADLAWMQEFAMPTLARGGVHLLGVPVGPETLVSDAHRIYGPDRLGELLSGWVLREVVNRGAIGPIVPLTGRPAECDWQNQPIMVLQRAEAPGA